jgi:hypothetical protein
LASKHAGLEDKQYKKINKIIQMDQTNEENNKLDIKLQRLFIENHIDSLSKEDHIYIFKIIQPHIKKSSTTDQDTVVDISRLPDNVIVEVKNMIEVCLDNNKRNEDMKKYKNEHESNMIRLENELLQKSKDLSFNS